jgi:hypothetical protein
VPSSGFELPTIASPVTARYSEPRAVVGMSSDASFENASSLLLRGLNW